MCTTVMKDDRSGMRAIMVHATSGMSLRRCIDHHASIRNTGL